MTFLRHIKHLSNKLICTNYAISKNKHLLTKETKLNIYNALFDSHLQFGSIIWGCANLSLIKCLYTLQKNAAKRDHRLPEGTVWVVNASMQLQIKVVFHFSSRYEVVPYSDTRWHWELYTNFLQLKQFYTYTHVSTQKIVSNSLNRWHCTYKYIQ